MLDKVIGRYVSKYRAEGSRPARVPNYTVRGFVPISKLHTKPIIPPHARPVEYPARPGPRWFLAPPATGENY